ncbi:MAG: rhomboid family intramembrane serine protease [Planctomycetota bacterium]|jgi:membrane associated rhomboid family serine protease
MGWQDRDYAQGPSQRGIGGPHGGLGPGVPGGGYGGGPFWLIRGSIVTTLIVVNVGIFLLQSFFPQSRNILYGWGSLTGGSVLHGQVWRLITAQYLHHPESLWHVAFNMLALYFLGRSLESIWSWKRFLTVYTIAGLAGNLFFVLLVTQGVIHPDTPAVGASGCIYGLIGIVAVKFPNAVLLIYGIFPVKMRNAAIFLGLFAAFTIWRRGSNFGGEACHFAGLVFGVWWAWRGEAWWSRTEWRLPGKRSRSTAIPRGFNAKVKQRRRDAETVDRLLRKIHEGGGIHTLSDTEKAELRDATERERIREQAAGRLDRL